MKKHEVAIKNAKKFQLYDKTMSVNVFSFMNIDSLEIMPYNYIYTI